MGDVASIVAGGTPKTSEPANFDGGELPWITPADLSSYREKYISRGARNITERGLKTSSARLMPANTVLFSSRAPIGYVAIASQPVTTSQGFKSFVLDRKIDSSYAYYFLMNAKELVEGLSGGTTFKEISGANAARIPIAIPPLAEQRRIVAEVEKQFTRLDASVAALRRAQANLKRYRSSVLKSACEGRLVPTEAERARSEGREYEPSAVLLECILEERRARWESDPKRRGIYKEPVKPDTTDLPELPEGWVWVRFGAVTQNFDGIRVPVKAKNRMEMQGEYPYYGASGIIDYVNEFLFEGRFLLIAEDGANLLSRNTPVAFAAAGQFWVNNHAHVVRPLGDLSLEYLGIYMNGLNLQYHVTGTAQPKLTQAALNAITVRLPPLVEQRRIVAEVERRLSVIQQAETAVEASMKRADRMRHSILKKAFAGELVLQDPNDEPASALLERIRAEREATWVAKVKPKQPRRRRVMKGKEIATSSATG